MSDRHSDRHMEAVREETYVCGAEHPDRPWILTDYDVWMVNPFYQGDPGPHPELDWGFDEIPEYTDEEIAYLEEMHENRFDAYANDMEG